MKVVGFLVLLFFANFLFGQQNTLPISSFYKDQLFRSHRISEDVKIQFIGSSFLPITEKAFNLHHYIRDSSVQYYEPIDYLFKKHLLEVKGDDYYITISPVVNMGLGQDFEDSLPKRLFNNTRGVLVEVDIMKNFSFMTSLFENQNRFTTYENDYYSSIGERYPKPDSTYAPQNAIIPGAARTKPFKEDGFDYAYAIGNVVYHLHKRMTFTAGNNSQFIGTGYRSLLLSDNSVPSVYFRGDFLIVPGLNYTVLRSKQFNLFRRPNFTTVEAYYEPKLFSTHYLEYLLNGKLSFGIFEGSYWNVGDSVSSKNVHGAYYLPLPFLGGGIVNNENEVSTLAGFQVNYLPFSSLKIYGQLAMSNWNTRAIGTQLGLRWYDVLGLKNSMIQAEYNQAPKDLYLSNNSRLNYSSYNLPTAHPKGNGFQELVFRMNYTKKRFYGDLKCVFYDLRSYEQGSLLFDNQSITGLSGQIYHQQIELGYRMNRKMNLEIFIQHLYRNNDLSGPEFTNAIIGGIRTGLRNHYNDF